MVSLRTQSSPNVANKNQIHKKLNTMTQIIDTFTEIIKKYETQGNVTILNSKENISKMKNLDKELEIVSEDCILKETNSVQNLSNAKAIM